MRQNRRIQRGEWPFLGMLKRRSCGAQNVQALEIESETDQIPLATGFVLTTQGELAEAQDFFDEADGGFDNGLVGPVDELAQFSLQLVGHVQSEWGIGRRRR